MSNRKRYPSDLSDERWALIEPVITAWKAAHRSVSGHQGRYEMREIVNAILYQSRTGCQWGYLPHNLPVAQRGVRARGGTGSGGHDREGPGQEGAWAHLGIDVQVVKRNPADSGFVPQPRR